MSRDFISGLYDERDKARLERDECRRRALAAESLNRVLKDEVEALRRQRECIRILIRSAMAVAEKVAE
jgi:hypothetical protein